MTDSMQKYSKVIAEINLRNLDFNLENIRKQTKPAKVIAVVKADAYGHGVGPVVRRLAAQKVDFFAVARIKEALELYNEKINGAILVFGRLNKTEICKAINRNIRITLTNLRDLEIIEQCASELGKKAWVHINIDTGMGRIGLFPHETEALAEKIKKCENILFEGIYSHFSTSDSGDKNFARKQLARFMDILDQLENANITFPLVHMANSGGILDMPETYRERFTAVRAGIMLYGCYPSVETSESIAIKPVMTIKTKVLEIRELAANSPVSYGQRYFTKEATKIAVLPIGYADGISRLFTNKGRVMIKGNFYPIVGTVTMDQIMIAVDDQVIEGDEVFFWGDTGDTIIKPSDVAETVGTISYELCTAITKRVLKEYKE
jgi:alanine racemase